MALAVVGEPILAGECTGRQRISLSIGSRVAIVVERDVLERLLQVDVATPVQSGLLGILIPREIEVVVGDGTQHDIVAAVRQTIREILGAPSRDVVPDVSAPPALGKTGIDDVDRLPFAMRFADGNLFPPRRAQALPLQNLLDPEVERVPEIVHAGKSERIHVLLDRG